MAHRSRCHCMTSVINQRYVVTPDHACGENRDSISSKPRPRCQKPAACYHPPPPSVHPSSGARDSSPSPNTTRRGSSPIRPSSISDLSFLRVPNTCAIAPKDEFFESWALFRAIRALQIPKSKTSPNFLDIFTVRSFSDTRFMFLTSISIVQAALLGGCGTRSGVLNEMLLQSPCFRGDNGGLGFLRGYLMSIGASKAVGARNRLYDWRFLLANPSFNRFFCSGSPRKKSKTWHYCIFNLLIKCCMLAAPFCSCTCCL